jgi:hypothetical protein
MDLARANALHDEATLLMAARDAGELIGRWKRERIGLQRGRQEAAHGTAHNLIMLGALSDVAIAGCMPLSQIRRKPCARWSSTESPIRRNLKAFPPAGIPTALPRRRSQNALTTPNIRGMAELKSTLAKNPKSPWRLPCTSARPKTQGRQV